MGKGRIELPTPTFLESKISEILIFDIFSVVLSH